MELVIVLTARCNAACTHCTTNCGPYRSEALSRDEVIRLMDDAAAIHDDVPLRFNITGGEPFLDFDWLVDVVTYGGQLGAVVTCTTNAYWAHSDEITHGKLSTLREAGLVVLSVSVSRFHQRYVPLQRVRRVLDAARNLDLRTELKGAVTNSDLEPSGAVRDWQRELDADRVNIFPILPYLREGADLPEEDYYRETGLPEQPCPSDIVCIEPDGTALSCCGSGVSKQFLSLGNIRDTGLGDIQQRFRTAPRQTILRERGPIFFARCAIEAGLGDLLRDSYAGPCDLCAHIASDPRLRQIAETVSAASTPDEPGYPSKGK
jgi:MoaA/NifB/PqqE/SkfB family radical SAM enzyme